MSTFERNPTRTNIIALPHLEERERLRDEALARFNEEEGRLTNRVRRVATGVWEAAKDTARVAWQWWGR